MASAKKATRSRSSLRKAAGPGPTKLSGVDRLERYVGDVLAGRVVACKEVKQACKRHRDDVRASKRKDFRWHFDRHSAERFIRFHEGLPHVKDDFKGHASRHERFELGDWQCFIYGSIFGWVDKKEGFRRFNDAYVEVPRKNGKTPNAAAICLFTLTADGEYGAEVFAGASSREQAGEVGSVFDTARQMALACPELRAAFGLWVNANSLVVAERNASFKKLKGKPQDGPAPHCVTADEYHEYATNRLIEWARTGMTSRRQPLLFRITTAGTNTASPCYEMHLEVQEMLEGRRRNDRLFGIIYTIDKGVDWKSKKALMMANPNFGVSVNPEQISDEQLQARHSASKQVAFKTKNLNIWQSNKQPWINMEHWDGCFDPAMKIEQFALDPGVVAVDLASRRDTVSIAQLFKRQLPSGKEGEPEWHYYCFTRHYLNAEQVRDEKHQHLADWAEKGYLIETAGNVTSYVQVCEDLAKDANNLIVREMVWDPYHASPLIQFLEARPDWPASVAMMDVLQNEKNYSPTMKEFEAAIDTRRFHHDGNPVITWMIGNTRCEVRRRTENWYPVRENIERKIDGTVAILLGLSRLMLLDVEDLGTGEVRWI